LPVFYSWPRRKARVFLLLVFCLALGLGWKKSDQSGFLPFPSSIFCLLIYVRQQRGNRATLIFWRQMKSLPD
jgi:hypothetical protein